MTLPVVLHAQNFSRYNWYFGSSNQAIRFSRSDNSAREVNYVPTPLIPLGTGGSAVASSKLNGDLLFYTDGVNVFDVANKQMLNGFGLTGNANANQPVAIAKVPGQVSQYYVFTNSSNFTTAGTISFSIVDMSLPGNANALAPPSGDVTNPKNTVVIGGRSEAMITVPHANGEDFWLITHANGTNDFDVFLFTDPIVNPVQPSQHNIISGLGLTEVAANLSYHEKTGRVALSPQERIRDVEIFDFDNALGTLSSPFPFQVPSSGLNSTLTQAIYDTEWSNSGQYLYISVHGDPGPTAIQADVLQYDLAAALQNQNPTLTSVLPQSNTIFRSYGLQMAPDSAIYHLYQRTAGGPFFVGKLTNTDTIPGEVIYAPQAFAGTINFAGLQFPSFAPSDTTGINLTIQPVTACANTPVTFYPAVTPGADSIVWDFGDGSGASEWSPVHTYTSQGPFTVTAIAFLNGQASTPATMTPNITQFDLTLSLVQDTTACLCEYKPPVGTSCNGGPFQVTVTAQNGTPQYQWFGPGGILATQQTATLIPDSAGYYYVTATLGGCTTHAGVNIKTYDELDQRANIWYFGLNAGIDFNPLPNKPAIKISNPVMDAPEGTSIICDRNGQVILFTDGDKVWDRDFNVVASGIGGEVLSSQSSLIVPVPGDETLYYIFTTTAVNSIPASYELRYSTYDLINKKIVDTDGNPATVLGTLLFTKTTERITSNGNWLIAHEFGNNSFRAYPITAQGIGNPVISSIGSDHRFSTFQNGEGYMELSSTGKLAVALSTPGTSNTVEIFDFIDSSGVVTNYRVADLKIPAGQVYGLEFSGSKLLTTWSDGTNSQIVEFFFNAGDSVFILKAPRMNVPPGVHLGAIQTGPDGQVYVAVEGAGALGTIQVDADTTVNSSSIFTLAGFPLVDGTTSKLGLPNFVQTLANPAQEPGITFTAACEGFPIDFTGSGKDSSIDKFDWNFGDFTAPLIDGGPQVSHTYAVAGDYIVTLKAYNKCEDPIPLPNGGKVTVTVSKPPALPIAASTSLCTLASTVLLEATSSTNPDLSNLDFLWSTGDTTRAITVGEGAYSITITDKLGCSSSKGPVFVVDNRPDFDLPANTDVCQDGPSQTLDAQNPVSGNTFLWTVTTGGVTTTLPNTIPPEQRLINFPVAGVFEYEVTVTTPGPFGCSAKDSTIFTVKQAPIINVNPATNTSSCGANDGSFSFDITGPTNTLFTYVTSIPPGNSVRDQGIGNYPFTNLGAGVYQIVVSDQVTTCQTGGFVQIDDFGTTTPIVTSSSNCDPIVLHVVHSAVALPITYRVLDGISGQLILAGTGAVGAFDISMPGVPPGSFIVEVTSGGPLNPCVVSSVPQNFGNPITTVAFDNTTICSGTLTATTVPAANTFIWSGPVTPANSSTVTVLPGSGTITLTASSPGGCPGTASIDVTDFIAAFTQSSACEDEVTLTATPVGNFNYQWTRDGVPIFGGQQIVISQVDDNRFYAVTVADQNVVGCAETSAPQPAVRVDGALTVFLTSGPACEGTPFTITATPSRTNVTSQWKFKALNQPIVNLPDTDLEATGTASGNYSVIVTSTTLASCTATADIPKTVSPLTPGFLSDQYLICPEGNSDVNHVVLDPDPNSIFNGYIWSPDGQTDRTIDVNIPGPYSVELVNQDGCVSTDQTIVKEECDPVIVGPTAFRPTSTLQQGGDMINQTFRLFTFFIADDDFQVFIFNRWGEMIYQTDKRDFRWNGGYNNDYGTQLPAGTYSYVVKYKSQYHPEQGIMEKHGGVVLLR